jgi:hypothetical protein
MKKIFIALFSLLAITSVFAQSTKVDLSKNTFSANSAYQWYIGNPEDSFEFTSTNAKTSILVTVDRYEMASNTVPDVATITCNGQSYDIYPGNAIRCDLGRQSKLIIQDKQFKNSTSGTYEIIS